MFTEKTGLRFLPARFRTHPYPSVWATVVPDPSAGMPRRLIFRRAGAIFIAKPAFPVFYPNQGVLT